MQNRFFKRVLLAAVAATAIAGTRANAALTITLSEPGFTSATFTDSGNTGAITNTVSFGTFTIFDIEAATSNKLASPTPAQATLEVTAIVMSTAGASLAAPQTLTITTSDNAYSFPGSSGSSIFMDSSASGTLAPATNTDVVNFQSIATPTDGVATTVTPGLQTYTSTGLNSGTYDVSDGNTNDTWTRGASFDLSNVITLSFHAPGEEANVSGTTTAAAVQTIVPEPATGALLLAGAAGLALRRRRIA